MVKSNSTMAQPVAHAAGNSQQPDTSHAPKAVTVLVDGEALVITLGAALPSFGIKPERRWAISSGLKT